MMMCRLHTFRLWWQLRYMENFQPVNDQYNGHNMEIRSDALDNMAKWPGKHDDE